MSKSSEKNLLAINGGTKIKTTPYGTGKRFGEEEIQELREALEQNTLFYWKGTKVKQFCEEFAQLYGAKRCVGVSSGTAGIHVAIGALGLTPGTEVITSPITDMGTLIGLLYQGCIPVFADLDPHTYNMDASSVEKSITSHTKAILLVHLAGNPCDMDKMMAIAKKHKLYVIEDCAQSYMCEYKGKLAGSFGDFGCFSLNDFKHISAGDAGMVITNDPELGQKAAWFADKNYYRDGALVGKSPKLLAPNYRMNELEGAVALAQLKKLKGICSRRTQLGDRLTAGIKDIPGIMPHEVTPGGKSSYWFYLMRIDEKKFGVSREDFAKTLQAEGINNWVECYSNMPKYMHDLLINRTIFPGSTYPLDINGRSYHYKPGMCPVAEEIIKTSIYIPISEFYTDQDIDENIAAIKKVAHAYLNA
ncbi:MAG: spore coat protein [Elusimicrobia bacterium RIFOXYB2_FULL_49_7]|nr:MAG: spore coat protein [Elusimicrobia bacterium RIFOXYB2_FULL_49_7]